MTTLEELQQKRPVDRALVEHHKQNMLNQVRAYRLRELREQAGLTQTEVARRIGVGQRQVSKIENGDLENTKLGTISGYLEAVGGSLSLDYIIGDQRIRVA